MVLTRSGRSLLQKPSRSLESVEIQSPSDVTVRRVYATMAEELFDGDPEDLQDFETSQFSDLEPSPSAKDKGKMPMPLADSLKATTAVVDMDATGTAIYEAFDSDVPVSSPTPARRKSSFSKRLLVSDESYSTATSDSDFEASVSYEHRDSDVDINHAASSSSASAARAPVAAAPSTSARARAPAGRGNRGTRTNRRQRVSRGTGRARNGRDAPPGPTVLPEDDAGSGRSSSDSNDEENLPPIARVNRLRGDRPLISENLHRKMREWHDEWDVDWDLLKATNASLRSGLKPVTQPPTLINVTLLPFQLEGLAWLQFQEDTAFNGGILADSMGMGKTIQTISLLVSKPLSGATLVVCPAVALYQWRDEIAKYTAPGTLETLIFHGANRTDSKDMLETKIVLTTYAIIESAYRKQQKSKGSAKDKSLLHSITWARIVLDEAHSIKDRSTSTARAVFALQSLKKWSLSGTPVKPYSTYYCTQCPCASMSWSFSDRSHCDECGHRPMAHFCWWNKVILKPIQKYGPRGEGLRAYGNLSILLDQLMLRRTKDERAEDLRLPPRIVTTRKDYFDEMECDFYAALFTETRTRFASFVRAGTVLNNYAHIFELLSRLRQAANHPFLVVHKSATLENPGAYVCGICQEVAQDAIVTRCKHIFCREDLKAHVDIYVNSDMTAECPVCFTKLSVNLDQEALVQARFDATKGGIVNRMLNSQNGWTSSTKIEALLEELSILRSSDSTIKSLVFSQFVSFLDLIFWKLKKEGYNCVKLDGAMTPEQRDSVIRTFMTVPQVTIFLISIKAGGIALNLTEASRVFLLDPWWNPAVEAQAMDRIHRLGQRRVILIKRLIIEDSIESRIVELQRKKELLFESTVGKDAAALERLTEEDLGFLFQM